jgi:tetratricopeptide (TPR) repeat protein
MRNCFVTLACLFVWLNMYANNYDDAWKALNRNDRKTAMLCLQKAMNDPSTAADAYITYMYLLSFEGRENEATDFISKVYDKLSDPNPYVYAMWFNKGVLGTYGKKTAIQQNLLDKIFNDGKCNGSLQSAAHYVESWSYVASNNFAKAVNEAGKMYAVGPLWQLVGPFDNLSGSGFDKQYGPLQHPEASAVFKSATNADISWFTPAQMNKDGWTFPYAHILYNTATIYAQEFVTAPEDMKVFLNAGFNGAIKVWVNDELILSQQKELVTELDYLKNYVQLKKGNNRLLVQLSYTNNSFPNFIIRFTDDNLMPVKNLSYTPTYQNYTPVTTTAQLQPSIKHFAEAFFENKIQLEPDNLVNYILLSETYLRNYNTEQARTLIEKAVAKFPDNALLRLVLMSCYIKEKNNTLLQQETERMKDKYPDCMLASRLNIQQLIEQEKYREAEEEIKKYDSSFNDEDEDMLDTKVQLYGAEQKIDTLVNLIQNAYLKHPENAEAVSLMFNVKMNVDKDAKGALEVYENYLKNNFNYDILKKLKEQYQKQGLADKELKLLNIVSQSFSYDPELLTDVSDYYYDQQNYTKAAEIGKQVLALAPYVSTYWQNLGLELAQQHSNDDAVNALKKAIYYNANNYNAREKLRELQNKPSIWKTFPDTDIDKLIQSNPDTIKDYDYYYLLDEKFAVVYPEGACEEYYTYVVKITDDKGIDAWKETNIS